MSEQRIVIGPADERGRFPVTIGGGTFHAKSITVAPDDAPARPGFARPAAQSISVRIDLDLDDVKPG